MGRIPRKLKKKIKLIPKDDYCYTWVNISKGTIKPCPYLGKHKEGWNICNFVGYYNWDVCLDDCCKICNYNLEYERETIKS